LSHLKAKHQKLAMDPGCTLPWVLPVHPLDQVTQTLKKFDVRTPILLD
jgi:hypothetical protein